jgi:hypothetical protein
LRLRARRPSVPPEAQQTNQLNYSILW